LTTGLGAAGVAGAAAIAGQAGTIPPDAGAAYGLGATLTYTAHRLLTRNSMAREFPREGVSTPFANGRPPKDEAFLKHQAADFADWRVTVDGLVERPMSLSLADLRGYPSRSQITQLACEEGWSYIAEWKGVPLSHVLNLVGLRPEARYVAYFSSSPGWWDSLDLADAWHPQTLLALGMNGGELPVPFGGPVRMRVPRQLGYKSVKYVNRLVAAADLKSFGKGLGSGAPEAGYSWYAGI